MHKHMHVLEHRLRQERGISRRKDATPDAMRGQYVARNDAAGPQMAGTAAHDRKSTAERVGNRHMGEHNLAGGNGAARNFGQSVTFEKQDQWSERSPTQAHMGAAQGTASLLMCVRI